MKASRVTDLPGSSDSWWRLNQASTVHWKRPAGSTRWMHARCVVLSRSDRSRHSRPKDRWRPTRSAITAEVPPPLLLTRKLPARRCRAAGEPETLLEGRAIGHRGRLAGDDVLSDVDHPRDNVVAIVG
jgi:hypothetical protein